MSASLFGIKRSNRDFTQRETWGKNQFNSSFPAALICYMHSRHLSPVYLQLDDRLAVSHSYISAVQLFGSDPTAEHLFFAFESDYTPYQSLVVGNVPRVDLVLQDTHSNTCLRGLEVKLTALPDNTTHDLPDAKFGAELVIRPDSIVYLALSMAMLYRQDVSTLKNIIGDDFDALTDWSDGNAVMSLLPNMVSVLNTILLRNLTMQEPLIVQPIWKTVGKSAQLAEHCLDVFVWSNFALTRLFLNVATEELSTERKITRQLRSIIWLFKMLYDFAQTGRIHHAKIIDELSYNTKNDKAFAVSGRATQPFMACDVLTKPRITHEEIQKIILGGGHLLLSPERRFDAILYNSPYLFQ